MNRQGYVSLLFLILFSWCVSMCSYLCHKSFRQAEMMLLLKQANEQVMRERLILEEVVCVIQCSPQDQWIEINGEKIWLDFEENLCFVEDMMIEFDLQQHRILNVQFE